MLAPYLTRGYGGTLQAYGYIARRTGTHVTQTCDTVLNG
jgi:hypothetical protein